MKSPTGQPTGEAKSPRDRFIEMFAVILLGVATVGSAWCGYQATRWNGEQDKLVRESNDARVEASRLFSLGTQYVAYDTNVVGQYAQAVAAKNQPLMDFYRTTLVRPAFLPILDRWLAEAKAGQSRRTSWTTRSTSTRRSVAIARPRHQPRSSPVSAARPATTPTPPCSPRCCSPWVCSLPA